MRKALTNFELTEDSFTYEDLSNSYEKVVYNAVRLHTAYHVLLNQEKCEESKHIFHKIFLLYSIY